MFVISGISTFSFSRLQCSEFYYFENFSDHYFVYTQVRLLRKQRNIL